jgi:glycosyltransferase involved in cell wall biosynthesis
VDARNHPHSAELNKLAHVVCWTQFAVDELRDGGYTGSASVVPLGVDTELFRPTDKETARQKTCPTDLPAGAFLVGVVGRNQPRKRVDLSIGYFAEWVLDYGIKDAYLYLHVAPTGERACDIRAVAAFYGPELVGRVFVRAPESGVGANEAAMPLVYGSFDVCLTTTQGEGWGLTTHEAMACGVPCVVPDYSALGEWTRDAALKVPCTSTALSAPLDNYPYTIGGVPDRAATVAALHMLYSDPETRVEFSRRGLALAARPELQWSAVGAAFRRDLEAALARATRGAIAPAGATPWEALQAPGGGVAAADGAAPAAQAGLGHPRPCAGAILPAPEGL